MAGASNSMPHLTCCAYLMFALQSNYLKDENCASIVKKTSNFSFRVGHCIAGASNSMPHLTCCAYLMMKIVQVKKSSNFFFMLGIVLQVHPTQCHI
jgi:hypothetical protein